MTLVTTDNSGYSASCMMHSKKRLEHNDVSPSSRRELLKLKEGAKHS